MAAHSPSLLRLEWAVRALAQDADAQPTLFPASIPVGEELALEFDQHYRALVDDDVVLPAPVTAALAALDAQLGAMAALDRQELWFDGDQLAHGTEWRTVRALARAAIEAMGCESTPPPADRDIYVVAGD
jgi:hypothetical protein